MKAELNILRDRERKMVCFTMGMAKELGLKQFVGEFESIQAHSEAVKRKAPEQNEKDGDCEARRSKLKIGETSLELEK